RAGVVGIGQPQALLRQRGDELIETEQTCRGRHTDHDPQRRCPCWCERGSPHHLVCRERLAEPRPDVCKRLHNIGYRGPTHFDARITPGLNLRFRHPYPHPPDAQARDKTDVAVDREHLPVITTEPAERGVQARRVVTTYVDATRTQTLPKSA